MPSRTVYGEERDLVAKRAGVGKQTIYRWWPSKGAVVLEALDERLAPVAAFPDTGNVVADVRSELVRVAEFFGATANRLEGVREAATAANSRATRVSTTSNPPSPSDDPDRSEAS